MLNSLLSEHSRAARVKAKFKSCLIEGSSTRTWVYDDVPAEIKTYLEKRVYFTTQEVPILVFYQDDGYWLLATTRRIIWSVNSKENELQHEYISFYGWSSGPPGNESREKSDKPDQLIYTKNGQRPCKTDSPWLYVIDHQNNRHELYLEPGSPLTAVWNSLKLFQFR